MEEKRYTISEASEVLDLESHVLRYWEEELELSIPRNELGHRYYGGAEIALFEQIKTLKEQGLQLKAIKMALQNLESIEEQYPIELSPIQTVNIGDPNNDKVKQFQDMIKALFQDALIEYNGRFQEELKLSIRQELAEEIQETAMRMEELQKERFRKIDETLREIQKVRTEIAVDKQKAKKQPWYLKGLKAWKV